MPEDRTLDVTTDTGRKVKIRAVFLEADEHFLLSRSGRGYTSGIPTPLCEHKHKRMDTAALCGLKAAQDLVASWKAST